MAIPVECRNRIDFYVEVRVLESPIRRVAKGEIGVAVGISESADENGRMSYGVMLDVYQRVVVFSEDQIEPTGKRCDNLDAGTP